MTDHPANDQFHASSFLEAMPPAGIEVTDSRATLGEAVKQAIQ